MKKIRILAMIIIPVLAIITACDKEEEPYKKKEVPEVKVQKSVVKLEVEQSETVKITGGDGIKYEISPKDSEIATAEIRNNILKFTAKKAGEETFTVKSAGKTAEIRVIVKAKPIPDLGEMVGVYKDGKLIVKGAMMVYDYEEGGVWIYKNIKERYVKRLFISFYEEGENNITIIAEGLAPYLENTGIEGKVINVTKEKELNKGKVQLASEKLRFIIEKKK